MVAYTKPQQRKKEECERLRGERDKIKFIDLRLEDGKLKDPGKQEEGETFHILHVPGINTTSVPSSFSWRSFHPL